MGFVGQFSQVLDLQRQWNPKSNIFEDDGQGGVVITVPGVAREHEDELVGKKAAGGTTLFKIADVPNGNVVLELMKRMMGQRAQILAAPEERIYGNTMGGEISILPALDVVETGLLLMVETPGGTKRAFRDPVC